MSKKSFDKYEKECPICGSIIWGKGVKVLLEGARITVCNNCAKHGQKIHTMPSSKKFQQIRNAKPRQNQSYRPKNTLMEKEIVEDYSRILRHARNKHNLTQEQFAQKINEKPSLLRRIEAGKAKPTIKLALKLEKAFDIKLLKDADEIDVKTTKFMKKSSGSSLGDIAFIKKKK